MCVTHNWNNPYTALAPSDNPVETCKAHCAGYDYFGMECPGDHGLYCTCMYTSEYDSVTEERPIYECLGECSGGSDPNTPTVGCSDRSSDGSRVDTNCPGMTVSGTVYSVFNGYALGASWRTTYYSI